MPACTRRAQPVVLGQRDRGGEQQVRVGRRHRRVDSTTAVPVEEVGADLPVQEASSRRMATSRSRLVTRPCSRARGSASASMRAASRGWAPRRSPWRASRRSASRPRCRTRSPESRRRPGPVEQVELAETPGTSNVSARRSAAASRAPGPRRRGGPRSRDPWVSPITRSSGRPSATASCSSTRSTPCTGSVTGCSTWSRVFISRKKNRSRLGVVEELDGARADGSRSPRPPRAPPRASPARPRRQGRARAPPRRPSGADAGSSSRARPGRGRRRGAPSTCTSTWRPCSTYGSTKTVPSPNADSASASASAISSAGRRACGRRASRARPAGRGLDQQRQVVLGRGSAAVAWAGPGRRPPPSASSTRSWSPSARWTPASGPTQVIPAAITARANSAFSERKP